MGAPEEAVRMGAPEEAVRMGAPEEADRMGAPEEADRMGAPEEADRMGAPEETSPRERLIRNCLVAAAAGAGAIHIWAAWAHSRHIPTLAFFVAVATLQLWWAAVVRWVRDAPWSVLIAGAAANAAVVVVWVLSRTTGLPGVTAVPSMDDIMAAATASPGTQSGYFYHQESFGLFDTTASLLEIAVIVGVVLLVRMRRRSSRVLPGDSP